MAEKQLEVFIITPDATEKEQYKYHGVADMVVLRCHTGDMGILPGRTACSATLDEGILRIFENETERKIAVLGGVFRFENETLTLITKKALLPGEIDIVLIESQIHEIETRKSAEADILKQGELRSKLGRLRLLLEVGTS